VSLSQISLHALRQGWATVVLEAGVPMKVAQDRFNDASVRITADIYIHVRTVAVRCSRASGRADTPGDVSLISQVSIGVLLYALDPLTHTFEFCFHLFDCGCHIVQLQALVVASCPLRDPSVTVLELLIILLS